MERMFVMNSPQCSCGVNADQSAGKQSSARKINKKPTFAELGQTLNVNNAKPKHKPLGLPVYNFEEMAKEN